MAIELMEIYKESLTRVETKLCKHALQSTVPLHAHPALHGLNGHTERLWIGHEDMLLGSKSFTFQAHGLSKLHDITRW